VEGSNALSSAANPIGGLSRVFPPSRGAILVFGCTLLGAAAQVLMKMGANTLSHPGLAGMITNLPLLGGYCLYGLSTVLLVLALKDGELSLLYPVIALTYVWVTILSVIIFQERLNPFKVLGVATIIAGVCVLGRGGARR
jgi:multidrug transporter EmrE-like cation transporter